MQVNAFYDSQQFIIGNTGDHQLTGAVAAWFLTLLFLALLTAGAWIAWREWSDDPAQRTQHHLSIWLMRTLIGCMWFQGSLWKLPLPVSGGLNRPASFIPHRIGNGSGVHFGLSGPAFVCCRHAINVAPMARPISPSQRVALVLHFSRFSFRDTCGPQPRLGGAVGPQSNRHLQG